MRKCSETPYPTNGSGKNPARDIHKCVYKNNKKYNFLFTLASASPEIGGKCRACEAKGASLRTQVRIISHVCSHLPLPTAIAATFPDKRGRLTFPILSFITRQAGTALLYFFFRNQSASTAFLCESFQYFLILLF